MTSILYDGSVSGALGFHLLGDSEKASGATTQPCLYGQYRDEVAMIQ